MTSVAPDKTFEMSVFELDERIQLGSLLADKLLVMVVSDVAWFKTS